jgi:membrane protease subunit (stomatin/prohibitin family)
MSFINMVSWENAPEHVYAWRYPEKNLTTLTQLVVYESQEAVLFSKGKIVGKFGPGKHTLSTENLPLLHELYGLPFGKKNPFFAEVWFVNKRMPLNLDWGFGNCLVSDPRFEQVPMKACGRYGLKVADSEKFLVKLVGTLDQFTDKELTDHFSGIVEQKVKSSITSFMQINGYSIAEISSKLNEIATALKPSMTEFWADYGFALNDFYITQIEIDTDTELGRELLSGLKERTKQNVEGYTWQQKNMGQIAGTAAGNSSDMGILGMAMMTGAFGGGGGGFGSSMMTPPQQRSTITQGGVMMGQGSVPQQQMEQQASPRKGRQMVYCSHCGKSYPTTNKFCPHCGNKYRPCPVCQADNDEHAKRCVSCGAVLPQSVESTMAGNNMFCPSCGAKVDPSTRFCPNCGTKIQ